MQDLVFDLKRMAERNRDGSLKTQADRKHMLMLMGEQLVEMGYKQLRARDLKGRHVTKLVRRWQAEGISAGTMANRMAALRWWAEKVDKAGVLAKSNSVYGIGQRQRITATSKGKVLTEEGLEAVGDPYIQMSLRLILAWGLRRKESLMLHPYEADGGDHLKILHNWAKNGRPRTIPVTFPEQREVLEEAKRLVKHTSASMIPSHLTYVEQRHKFDYWVQVIGLGGAHGLRHSWAQRRYAQLAGFPCPHQGGPLWDEMTAEQQEADREARKVLSAELGHNRSEIVQVYIGSNRGRESASAYASDQSQCPLHTRVPFLSSLPRGV